MLRKQLLLNVLTVALMLSGPALAQGQAVTCQPLSDDEAVKFITERGQKLVKGSAVECKVGETLILIRFQIVEYTARYDCEVRAKGEKPYCWRLSSGVITHGRQLFFLGMHAVALNEAPRRIVEMETSIADVRNQGRASIVAVHAQDETAIGTGDRFGRHSRT